MNSYIFFNSVVKLQKEHQIKTKNLSTSKQKLNTLKEKLIKHKNTLVVSEETNIKYNLSITLIDKLNQIIEELSNSQNDLHKHVSTLRYILETLIMTKLLISENNYFAKIFFSIYKQQENKTKQMIIRIENEIEILKKYSKQYLLQIEKNRLDYSTDLLKLSEKNEETFQSFKKNLQEDINIFFNQLEEFGFEGLIPILEKYTLSTYKEKLAELENLTLTKAKHLSKQQWFKNHFGTRVQHTKVFKLLEDDRSWKEKAKIVGLEKEYNLNYELTSSLLHFTSYSLSTSNVASKEEIEYNFMLINQYICQITTNINAFSRVIMFDLFTFIKV